MDCHVINVFTLPGWNEIARLVDFVWEGSGRFDLGKTPSYTVVK